MVLDDSIFADNETQRVRLEKLVSNGIDYQQNLGDGWNVAVSLAHMAFWDRRVAGLIHRWDVEGSLPDPVDEDLMNATLLPEWSVIDHELTAELAVTAAALVDNAIRDLDGDKADAIVMMGNQFLVDRATHRRQHLDQIEKTLGL